MNNLMNTLFLGNIIIGIIDLTLFVYNKNSPKKEEKRYF